MLVNLKQLAPEELYTEEEGGTAPQRRSYSNCKYKQILLEIKTVCDNDNDTMMMFLFTP